MVVQRIGMFLRTSESQSFEKGMGSRHVGTHVFCVSSLHVACRTRSAEIEPLFSFAEGKRKTLQGDVEFLYTSGGCVSDRGSPDAKEIANPK